MKRLMLEDPQLIRGLKKENELFREELRIASAYVQLLKEGNFAQKYESKSKDTVMANALESLRDRMQLLMHQERQRNWINEGIARFAEILRVHQHNNMDVLFDKLIATLVSYIEANQGGVFVLNETQANDRHLQLIACYAYQKKKFINKRLEIKEGLVGQCFLEKDVIYMTNVPDDYVEITSGLGHALPRSILIVPMMLDSEVLGVIELASFNIFEKYQIEFVSKIAESVASAYSGLRIRERTNELLQASQMQSEQLRAQEEEMRQNMEEMQATQEEIKRIQLETEAQTNIINNVAIVSKTDVRGNITYVNEEFIKWSKYRPEELIGKNHRILKSGHQPDEIFTQLWTTISNGKIWRGEVKNRTKDGTYYWVDAIIAPVLDDNGKPKEYIAQRFVINDKKEKEGEMKQILAEAQAKEEELRQNMEEMKAIQEEMSRVQREIEAQMNIINSVAIVSKTDPRGNITYVNDEFIKWSKYTREELIGRNHRILKSGQQPDEIFTNLWSTISSGKIWRGEVLNKAKDGSHYWVDAIIAPVLNSDGKPVEYIAQRFVINERKANARQ